MAACLTTSSSLIAVTKRLPGELKYDLDNRKTNLKMKKSSIGLCDAVVSEESMLLHTGRLNAVPGCCTRVVYHRKRVPAKSVANAWLQTFHFL